MNINDRTLICFDLETWGGFDVQAPQFEVIEIAALAIDGATLRKIPGATFETLVKPSTYDHFDPGAYKVNKIEVDEIKARGIDREVAWKEFAKFVKGFNPKGNSPFSAPVPCGKNIRNFDLPAARRFFSEFKVSYPFDQRFYIDFEDDLLRMFGHRSDLGGKFSMDHIRPFFGLSGKGAHRGMPDVIEEAELLVRFLGMYRKFGDKVQFKGALANV